MPDAVSDHPPALSWSWRLAGLGTAYALPAALATLADPATGIPLALGVLPATMVGLPPRRRGRVVIAVLGALAGLCLFVGGVLANVPVLAVLALFGAVVGAAWLTSRVGPGRIVLLLCVPLAAAGLSYSDLSTAAATFGLMVLGGCYALVVALAWPERPVHGRRAPALPASSAMLDYGVRMGLAAALAATTGFVLGLEHVGWAPAACLLVARPEPDLLKARGVGRLASVVLGALLAALLVELDVPYAVTAAALVVALAAAAATRGSRWYVASAFTTFLVLLALLGGHPAQAESRFVERVGETALGVGLAYLFGWAVPVARNAFRTRRVRS